MTTITGSDLMRPARLYYATEGQATHAVGVIIAYCDVPQVCIETGDGKQVWWRADLAETTGPRVTAEPTGLGAVVETKRGERWVRSGAVGTDEWRISDGSTFSVTWKSLALDVVRILSEGVPA